MSQENVAIVREVFDAWNRGEFDAAIEQFADEEIELHIIGGFADLVGEVFVGRERIVRFWRDMATTLALKIEVEAVFEEGERVAVILNQEALGAESGTPATMRYGQVWTFRDPKVIRVDSYFRAGDALEAAGLSE